MCNGCDSVDMRITASVRSATTTGGGPFHYGSMGRWLRLMTTLSLTIVICLCLVLAASGVGLAATGDPVGAPTSEESEPTIDDPEELEAVVDEALAERIGTDVPGATIVVVEGDSVVLEKGYGEADVAAGTPVEANETTFNIASVSKLITWTAVMQGVEDGTLDLDEDVNTYLEDSAVSVPETYEEPVTLRYLGTHTAGFDPVHESAFVADEAELEPLEETLVETKPDRVAPPGERVAYSNYGTGLAGHIVAEAYNTTFEAHVQSTVFDPLEMNQSTFAQPVPEDQPGTLATAHTGANGEFDVSEPGYVSWEPAGAMHSSAPDMAAFMQAHLEADAESGHLVEGETASAMQAHQYERHEAVNNWRFGFYEYGPPENDLIAHSGAKLHYTSKLVLAPEDDVGVFVAYNVRNEASLPSEVADEVLEAYGLLSEDDGPEEGAEPASRSAPASPPEAADHAQQVAGEYDATLAPETGPAQFMTHLIRLSVEASNEDDGRLVTDQLGASEREWVETDPHVYREVDGTDVLAAEVDQGELRALHLNGQPQVTYTPVASHERTLVVAGTLGVAIGGFAFSVLGWSGLAVWRRVRRFQSDTKAPAQATAAGPSGGDERTPLEALRRRVADPTWLIRVVGRSLAVLSLAFVGLFLAGFAIDGQLAFVTMPAPFALALALPWLIAMLALGTAVGTVLAWQKGYYSRRVRLHFTALTLLGIGFVWHLYELGLVGL